MKPFLVFYFIWFRECIFSNISKRKYIYIFWSLRISHWKKIYQRMDHRFLGGTATWTAAPVGPWWLYKWLSGRSFHYQRSLWCPGYRGISGRNAGFHCSQDTQLWWGVCTTIPRMVSYAVWRLAFNTKKEL